ncbi:OB-fold domain-containing protein [Dactylosporangium sp. NPDC051484]|uniref:Zn-ribbon domain-containing OB-fold protein n=1 Tax=Dactylosporangium sp. NPDC051484 TaxID=3154942 RepID=UPI00344D412C
MSSGKPVPVARGEEATWFAAAREGRLAYQRCGDCGDVPSYPRAICPTCWSSKLHEEQSVGHGIVYSFTVQYRAGAKGFESEVPYTLVLVDLDEGFRVLADLHDCDVDSVAVGLEVQVYFDDVATLPHFRPVDKVNVA